MASKILNSLGTILILLMILLAVPLTVPKLFGYQLYGVLSGSMEPVFPVGSVVYVKEAKAEDGKVGDPITFKMSAESDVVATHRVTAIDDVNRVFTTKGDANEFEDSTPISFDRLIGKAVFCIPYLGSMSVFLHSKNGIAAGIAIFAAALILWTAGDILKKKASHKKHTEVCVGHQPSVGDIKKGG